MYNLQVLIFTMFLEHLTELTHNLVGQPGPPGRSIIGKPGPPGIQGPPGKSVIYCMKSHN